MANYTYNYQIKSVDSTTKTMVVEYDPNDVSLTTMSLNIPVPDAGTVLEDWINKYAPQSQWEREANLHPNPESLIGLSGTLTTDRIVIDPAVVNSESGDQSVVENLTATPANTVNL